MKEILNVLLVQSNTTWENVETNLHALDKLLLNASADLILLPETFSTGFSMDSKRLAEAMDGRTVTWMKKKAAKLGAVISGSAIIRDQERIYNRLLWVSPSGSVDSYDKRHLFGPMGEPASFSPGATRKIFSLHGWRVCPLICYDLRFPVWCRNQDDYDLLVYVANWPVARHLAWKTLLRARAIENQSYCIGLNRTGQDGNGVDFGGSSLCFDPLGANVIELGPGAQVSKIQLTAGHLSTIRSKLPFLKDRDTFTLNNK